jgi:hypothetical protein
VKPPHDVRLSPKSRHSVVRQACPSRANNGLSHLQHEATNYPVAAGVDATLRMANSLSRRAIF